MISSVQAETFGLPTQQKGQDLRSEASLRLSFHLFNLLMTTLATAFRRYLLLAAMPAAALAFSGCGDDDNGPSQGRVMAIHAAASANARVRVLVDNAELGQLNYGQNTAYVNAASGSRTVKVDVVSTTTPEQNAITQTLTIAADQDQSLFAYAPDPTTVALLAVPDDLTAPAAGQAKIRLVHLGQGVASPLNLSQASVTGGVTPFIQNTSFPTASAFTNIAPGDYNFAVTTSAGAMVAQVGNGTGAGTGVKTYVAGKIYTVVLRGINNNFIQTLRPQATVIENN